MSAATLDDLRGRLAAGELIPYLGPGLVSLGGENAPVPGSADALVAALAAKLPVPGRLRRNLGAAAQYIENFRHRRALKAAMQELFGARPAPATPLHRWLAGLPALPLVVELWYHDAMGAALQSRGDWGRVQGASRAEHREGWYRWFSPDGAEREEADAAAWRTLLYQPWGALRPDAGFLVSDSDFVEVLTEIDIQTPIPPRVQALRSGRGFLFLGCRFDTQLDRAYARQIMKRSGPRHWAVLDGPLSRNEERFLREQCIERLDVPLAEAVREWCPEPEAVAAG
jgi:hypothetical protein